MVKESTSRPSAIAEISNLRTWLDEPVLIKKAPRGISARLYGTYSEPDSRVTISLIIDYRGTEYRTVRYNKPVHRRATASDEFLEYMHRNMLGHFRQNYSNKPWPVLRDLFLKWTTNKSYAEVFKAL